MTIKSTKLSIFLAISLFCASTISALSKKTLITSGGALLLGTVMKTVWDGSTIPSESIDQYNNILLQEQHQEIQNIASKTTLDEAYTYVIEKMQTDKNYANGIKKYLADLQQAVNQIKDQRTSIENFLSESWNLWRTKQRKARLNTASNKLEMLFNQLNQTCKDAEAMMPHVELAHIAMCYHSTLKTANLFSDYYTKSFEQIFQCTNLEQTSYYLKSTPSLSSLELHEQLIKAKEYLTFLGNELAKHHALLQQGIATAPLEAPSFVAAAHEHLTRYEPTHNKLIETINKIESTIHLLTGAPIYRQEAAEQKRTKALEELAKKVDDLSKEMKSNTTKINELQGLVAHLHFLGSLK